MSTEIKVKASPNTSSSRIFTFDIRDMGYTPEEWEALSENERQSAIQKELDGEPEQPYWEFDEIID